MCRQCTVLTDDTGTLPEWLVQLNSSEYIYRLAHCKYENWRALAALLVSVPPNMPGLINSINPSIHAGNAVFLFDVAYLFGVCLSL
jgi:cytosine/uracil/thiamine/allantoin permease